MRFALISFIITIYIGSINAFVPPPRAEVAAILVDHKIYFNGGWNGSSVTDFFFLDVSAPFTTNNLASMPWTDLSLIPGRINRSGHTVCINGTNSNLLVYVGGAFVKETDLNFTFVFDISKQQWSTPITSGNITSIQRLYIHCISSGNKIYIYGGDNDLFSMLRLDVSNLFWSTFSSGIFVLAAPEGYSATLLNDTSILYIGGGQNLRSANPTFSYLSLDKLPLYNINDNTWSFVSTSGSIPSPRIDHGAVYIPQYNQILMFYGSSDTSSIRSLDTLNFIWSVPTISNVGGSQSSLFSFTSILVGAYILIAFGRFNDSMDTTVTNNIFLLDVSKKDNYKWTTTFDPTVQLQSIQSTPMSTNTVNIGAIIGGIFGGIAGLIILITAAILIIKRYGHPYYSNSHLVTSQELSSNQPISK